VIGKTKSNVKSDDPTGSIVTFIFNDTITPDAILGKTFFGQQAPGNFGRFDVALVSMFCVAAGMGWPPVRAGRCSDESDTPFI
jgi:hypothetical protein